MGPLSGARIRHGISFVMDTSQKLSLTRTYTAGRSGLRRLLTEGLSSSDFEYTAYVTPAALRAPPMGAKSGTDARPPWLANVLDERGDVVDSMLGSDTGVALFVGDRRTVAIKPPFPLARSRMDPGVNATPMLELLDSDPLAAVVLLRLGRYAVGVVRGEELLASKTDTRYVKSRHRKGGSSQRRFERSRERLVRELYDKACEVSADVLAPFGKSIDYLLLGGERHTLQAFVKRCRLIRELAPKTLSRRLPVDRPGRRALESMPREVWRSRVLEFASGEPDRPAAPAPT